MPVRFGYRSGDPLRMLNALIMSDRRERQSDKEMALSALMFNIKREEGEKDRALKQLNIVQERVIEARKQRDKGRRDGGVYGGTLQSLNELGTKSGISSEASMIVYQSMSKKASDVEDYTSLIKKLESEYGSLEKEIGGYDASIRDYHTGLGRAAADAWREYGGDAKVDSKEFDEFLTKLKTDEIYQISDPKSFETGLVRGLQELTTEAADIKAKESLAISRQQSKN